MGEYPLWTSYRYYYKERKLTLYFPLTTSIIITIIWRMKPINIKDKKIFDDYLTRYPPVISEFTFTNLFCWRHSKKNQWTIIDDHLVISFFKEEKLYFYQPIGPEPQKIIMKIFEKHPETVFERVDKAIASKLDGLKVEEDRDNFDYVYSKQDLIEMPGSKFRSKKNFINRCLRLNPKVEDCSPDNIEKKYSIQLNWLMERDDHENLQDENLAIKEALQNFHDLNLHSLLITIDNQPAGFLIGEKLNDTTYVDHFEKGISSYQGIYQYMLWEFAKSLPEDIKFINREQDLGVEGLRKAKQSYNPVFMTEKFRISR